MRKLFMIIMIVVLAVSFTGCMKTNSDVAQSLQTEETMSQLNDQVGMPNLTNFYEKKLMKEIYELRDDSNLVTYAYMQNLDGQFVYLGKSIGYGLPYSVQYTNPMKYQGVATKEVRTSDTVSGIVTSYEMLPQPEPNGLFMPEGLSATWIILINEDTGEREIMYTEPNLVVTQNKMPKRLCAEWSLPANY